MGMTRHQIRKKLSEIIDYHFEQSTNQQSKSLNRLHRDLAYIAKAIRELDKVNNKKLALMSPTPNNQSVIGQMK